MSRRKVFICALAATGHTNGMLALSQELVKEHDFEVIFYSIEQYREQIEKSGALYRAYSFNPQILFVPRLNNQRKDFVMSVLKLTLDATNEIALELARDIDRDKPDVILHDQVALYARFAIKIINDNYARAKQGYKDLIFRPTGPASPSIMYYTTFAAQEGIYPNESEMELFREQTLIAKLKFLFSILQLSIKQFFLCRKFGVKFYNLIRDSIFPSDDVVKIVFVQSDLHPRSHLFHKSFKFVGSAINDEIHHDGYSNKYSDELCQLVDEFPIINPIDDVKPFKQADKKLIFASLGTAFQYDFEIYEKIILAFNRFDDESTNVACNVKMENIRVIISTGIKAYEYLNEKINSNELKKHKNILLVPSAPQIDILKRSSLFITHCGMNSSSETVHFGVPVVCIPLTADQPPVAHRLTYELGFGIQLSFINLKYEELRKAIHQVLGDESYQKRILRFSKLSHSYIGTKIAAQEIINYISKNK